MMTWLKRIAFLVGLFAVIQLVRPATNNPSTNPDRGITASMRVDPEVGSLLKRSCYDCHSNDTVWPWYSKVAPASWMVATDVKRGRNAMNFSDWASLEPAKQTTLLLHICEEVKEGEMPGHEYTIAHPDSRLTRSDVGSICSWTNSAVEIQHRAEK